ncbi:hypothetical protein Hanom_Chr07g00594451 [Helianthus anomalus]
MNYKSYYSLEEGFSSLRRSSKHKLALGPLCEERIDDLIESQVQERHIDKHLQNQNSIRHFIEHLVVAIQRTISIPVSQRIQDNYPETTEAPD